MNCAEFNEKMAARADLDVGGPGVEDLAGHLRACPACRAEAARLAGVERLVREAEGVEEDDAFYRALHVRVMAAVAGDPSASPIRRIRFAFLSHAATAAASVLLTVAALSLAGRGRDGGTPAVPTPIPTPIAAVPKPPPAEPSGGNALLLFKGIQQDLQEEAMLDRVSELETYLARLGVDDSRARDTLASIRTLFERAANLDPDPAFGMRFQDLKDECENPELASDMDHLKEIVGGSEEKASDVDSFEFFVERIAAAG